MASIFRILIAISLLPQAVSAQAPVKLENQQYKSGGWFVPENIIGTSIRLELWIEGELVLEGVGPAGPRSKYIDKKEVKTILAAQFVPNPYGDWVSTIAKYCEYPFNRHLEANFWLAGMEEEEWIIGLSVVGCNRILLKTYHFLAFDKEVIDGDCDKFCMKSAPASN